MRVVYNLFIYLENNENKFVYTVLSHKTHHSSFINFNSLKQKHVKREYEEEIHMKTVRKLNSHLMHLLFLKLVVQQFTVHNSTNPINEICYDNERILSQFGFVLSIIFTK